MANESFSISSFSPTDGVLVVQVVGALDAETSHRLTAEFDEWVGITELVINLHDCTSIAPNGLTALIECRRQIGFDATMRLIGVDSDVEHTLRLAGLETVLGLDPIA